MTRTRVSLVTLGSPRKQTGGYLYHRRLAEAAPRHDAELTFVSFPERAFPLAASSARGVVSAASDADVVVVDSIAAGFTAFRLRRAEPPVVGMLHQGLGGIDHGPLRTAVQAWLDERAYARMQTLLVASESLAAELHGVHADVRVVAPGRDTAPAPHPEITDLRLGRGAALLCVGNWIPRKGILDLLEAFEALPEGAATLHLVGDAAADPRYAARIRRRLPRLGDRVVVHGMVPPDRVAAFYRDADVFVMPSRKEPYGTVYGEAMAAGLPVVGWRAGNLPYLATDGREGMIVDVGDVAALAGALRTLAEDDRLRRAMGEAARARAESFPTWDETAHTFFAEVRDVIAAG